MDTVIITLAILKSWGSCRQAQEVVEPLLPAQVHTEPEANLEIASALITKYMTTISCTFADCKECHRSLRADLHWLLDTMGSRWAGTAPDEATKDQWYERLRNQDPQNIDPKMVAEFLAFFVKSEVEGRKASVGDL